MPLRVLHSTSSSITQTSTCDVRIRTLKVLPGADKNPPNFMTLLNHAAPLTQEKRPTMLDALNRAVTRGDKLFTGAAKENLDMMFTKLIIHEDLSLNLGESTNFHDLMMEVSKGSYNGIFLQWNLKAFTARYRILR